MLPGGCIFDYTRISTHRKALALPAFCRLRIDIGIGFGISIGFGIGFGIGIGFGFGIGIVAETQK